MTLSIDLPERALARLRAEASRRGVSIDDVIAGLADLLPAQPTVGGAQRRRLSFAGTLTAEEDFAERSEEILDEIIRHNAG
jgi:hypothetical protein